jgi:hypothetical protein
MIQKYTNLFVILVSVLAISCSSTKEISQGSVTISKVVISILDSSFKNVLFRDTVDWHHYPCTQEIDSPLVVKQMHPVSIQLLQEGPNPFSPPSNIWFRVNVSDTIGIKIITTDSLLASTSVVLPQGEFRLLMNDLRGRSGLYFFRVSGRDTVIQKKMIYLR